MPRGWVLRFRWLTRPGRALTRRRGGLLDHRFDARGLYLLRTVVLAHAVEAGMPENRARDVMLAAHELAANAVRHGAGTGRLQMRAEDGMLRVQVHDAGPASLDGQVGTAGLDGQDIPVGGRDSAWPHRPGHGLWVVRQVSDQMSVWRGAGRAGGDGGLCAARCGSIARTGRRGWLLTVWPDWGSLAKSPQVPRRVPPWGVSPAGWAHDASRPGAAHRRQRRIHPPGTAR